MHQKSQFKFRWNYEMPQFLNFILLSNYFLSKSTDWQVRAAPGDHDRGWAVWLARLPPTGGGLCNGSWRWCSCDKGTICPQLALAKHFLQLVDWECFAQHRQEYFVHHFNFKDWWYYLSVQCLMCDAMRLFVFLSWEENCVLSFGVIQCLFPCQAGDFDFHF